MRSLFTVVFVFSVAGCASKPDSPHEYYVENDLKYQKAWFIINLNQKIEKNQSDLRCVRVSTTHEALLDCLTLDFADLRENNCYIAFLEKVRAVYIKTEIIGDDYVEMASNHNTAYFVTKYRMDRNRRQCGENT